MGDEEKGTRTKGYACHNEGVVVLEELEYDLGPVGYTQALVEMKCSGICASDLGACANGYGGLYQYPLVPGHEGVGVVVAVGEGVKHLVPGDRVGCGIYRNQCDTCQFCLEGRNNLCVTKPATMMFAVGNRGTFGNHVLLDAKFAFKLPESIESDVAGPLMCAGMTTFAPFRTFNIPPTATVGIIGLGGLGHLSIQFSHYWGCETIAISGSDRKRELALELGADLFVSGEDAFDELQNRIDFLMITASGSNLNWPGILGAMNFGGTIILMEITMDRLPLSPVDLLLNGALTVSVSAAACNQHASEMLKFSARHGIKPMVEVFPISEINDAFSHVAQGKATFRAVVRHGE